ncbi:MAG: heavy metal-binding domain-containing protein [Dehalococcoidia bacterium]|nr:heavy metal-binding domain-containing protein [Dehalococcoidia bacterium]
MTTVTTPGLEGRRILAYKGIVTVHAVLGMNLLRDWAKQVRDVVGGRVGAYERELANREQSVLQELREKAVTLGANAVVGVKLDHEAVGEWVLMVTASGTAIVVEELASPLGDSSL